MSSSCTTLQGIWSNCAQHHGVARVAIYIIQTVPGEQNDLPADTSQPEEEAVRTYNKNTKSLVSIEFSSKPDSVGCPRDLSPFVLPVSSITSLMPCTLGA